MRKRMFYFILIICIITAVQPVANSAAIHTSYEGAVATADALQERGPLAALTGTGQTVLNLDAPAKALTAEEVYRSCTPAVFYLEV